MGKLVVLKLGEGGVDQEFPVTLQIGEEGDRPFVEVNGKLPPAPELLQNYSRWQYSYHRLGLRSRLEAPAAQVTNVAFVGDCRDAAQELRDRLNAWLQAETFRPIREKWLEQLSPNDEIRVILQGADLPLQRLPWHLWDLLERYTKAELALSAPIYQRISPPPVPRGKIRILAILGNSAGIDVQADRVLLEQLPDADVSFLVEPDRQDLTDRLWERRWDILFFAGHSASQPNGETGQIYINPTDSLSIGELRYALKKAMERGLKLAIFNSCDGLGLARELADLQLPQMVVMREPVPDRVAQEFLKYFLSRYAQGESLYQAVRQARERLQGLETEFPCATWLPVICQNPAEVPPHWQDLGGGIGGNDLAVGASSVPSRWRRLTLAALISLAVASFLMGGRYLGLLQPLELESFDQLMRLRPEEKPDSRLLLVTITEEDVQAQAQEQRRGSLSDRALDNLLDKLATYQPQVIGLDVYRDYPVASDRPGLAQKLRQTEGLVAVCRVSDPVTQKAGIAPPPEVPSDRWGFSDFVVDRDGLIRRHLLAMAPPPTSPCTAPYALNVQLALRYLESRGVKLEFDADGAWKLGKARFKPLESHTGGFQGIDAWGHQILLNYRSYRSPENFAPRVTLSQVLAGQINGAAIRNQIVLIGTTADSFHDASLTPYTTVQGATRKVPGVILQAQMVSQLISAALDGRSLLWVWPLWAEGLWVLAWAGLGAGLGYSSRRLVYLLPLGGGLVLLLYCGCFTALVVWGGWLPLVPAALAIVSSGAIVSWLQSFPFASSTLPVNKS